MRRSCFVLLVLSACRTPIPQEGIQVVLPMDGHYGTSGKFLFRVPVFPLEESDQRSLGRFYDESGRAALGVFSNMRVSEWVTDHLVRALRADVVNAYRLEVFPSKGLVISGKIVHCSVEGSKSDPLRVACRLWIRFILYKDGKFCRKVEFSESETMIFMSEPAEHVLTRMLRSILSQAVPELVRLVMAH